MAHPAPEAEAGRVGCVGGRDREVFCRVELARVPALGGIEVGSAAKDQFTVQELEHLEACKAVAENSG